MIKQMQQQYAAALAKAKSLREPYAENPAAMPEDATKEYVAALDEAEALKARIADAQREEALKQWGDEIVDPLGHPAKEEEPLTLARTGRVTAFTGRDAATKAYQFGQFIMAVAGSPNAKTYCEKNGIAVKTHSENVNSAGGFLVPPQFSTELIDLRERYGTFRRNCRVVPMTSDTLTMPRRTGGLTAYFTAEGGTITESQKSWDRITLTARKLAVLSKLPSELNEDSAIALGNDLAEEIAYAFATTEDSCGWNGDGTSTYGGITGVLPAIKGLTATIANIAGLVVGSGNAYSELVLNDFIAVVGLLPQYADGPGAKWFMHRSFFANVAQKLALAAGGVTSMEIRDGYRVPTFLGYPVEICQSLPKTEANSQVCCMLGDLGMAAKMGDRRQTTIALSEHLNFAEDEIAIRGTERFDIVVHDVGNQSATAGSRQAGPIVGLITAAS